MKKTILAGAIMAAVTLGMSGCAFLQNDKPQAVQFNYTTRDAELAGLVRAFDMNGGTVLQFVNLSTSQPKVYDAGQSTALPYHVVGQYAVLVGIHQALLVQSVTGSAAVNRTGSAPTTTPTASEAADADKPQVPRLLSEVLQQTVAELDATKKELADVKQQLAAQLANPRTSATELQKTNARIDSIEQRMTDAAGVIVRVNFDFASTAFAPTDEARAELLAGAKAASRINVRGHTDSPKPDQANYSVALGRALSTRQYLVKNGIDAKKIHLFAQAAGGFIAENRSDQGRRQNRRVEIELIGNDAVKVAAAESRNKS